jgi:hypothetical protein
MSALAGDDPREYWSALIKLMGCIFDCFSDPTQGGNTTVS